MIGSELKQFFEKFLQNLPILPDIIEYIRYQNINFVTNERYSTVFDHYIEKEIFEKKQNDKPNQKLSDQKLLESYGVTWNEMEYAEQMMIQIQWHIQNMKFLSGKLFSKIIQDLMIKLYNS